MSRISQLMTKARESLEEGQIEGVDVSIPEEEAAVALADTDLPGEVVDTVVEPVTELEAGLDDVDAIQADADGIVKDADTIEATLSDDGAGADPLAVDLATDEVVEAVERWALKTNVKRASKESFNSTSGRRAASESYVAMAREAASDMYQRAVEAVKTAWEWLKKIVEEAFNRSTRLQSRAKALVSNIKNAQGGGQLRISGLQVLGGMSPTEASDALAKLSNNIDAIKLHADADSEVALNESGLGGATFKLVYSGGKGSFVSTPKEVGEVEVKSQSTPECSKILGNVLNGLKAVERVKRQYEAASKDSGILAALKDDTGRAAALSRVTATSRAMGAITKVAMTSATKLIEIVEKSTTASTPNAAKNAEKLAGPGAGDAAAA